MNHNDVLSFGNSTTQVNRLIKALRPDYVQIDDRKLSDMLAFIAEYSKLISYYDNQNRVKGNWEGFFKTDLSVILAVIINTRLEDIEKEYSGITQNIIQTHTLDNKKKYLYELFRLIYAIGRRFDEWMQLVNRVALRHGELENKVEIELQNIIQLRLVAKLHQLRTYAKETETAFGQTLGLNFELFETVWDLDNEFIQEEAFLGTGKEDKAKISTALVKLRLLYRSFHDTLSYVVYHFQKHFEQSITHKDDHKADVGLFIAFLQLFKHSQDSLNYLSSNFLQLYYEKILHQFRLPSIPDKVHLSFELADHANNYMLEKGTQLIAGRDEEGEEIIYETIQEAELNQANIQQLKTLFFNKDERETISNFKTVTQVYAAPEANSKDGKGTPFDIERTSWPTFGESQIDKLDEYRNMDYADLGFAIVSPMFFLREGNRSFNLHFHFDSKFTKTYEKIIEDIRVKAGLATKAEAFYKVFNLVGQERNISIFATGSRGWIEVDSQLIRINLPDEDVWSPDQFVITFRLEAGVPPIVAWNPDVHDGEQFVPGLPVIKIVLNTEREPYAYSFVRFLKVSKIDIKVKVDKLKRFQVYNDIGQLDPTQPFQAFGPNPTTGSHLLIGNSEMFKKPLEAMYLNIEWLDLPKTAADFRDYYKGYDLEPNTYQVELSALSNNEFYPKEEENQVHFDLFEKDEEGVLTTHFDLDARAVSKLDIIPEPELENINYFDNETQSGYFRLELTSPDEAFGHAEYQKVITKAMSANSKIISDAIKSGEEMDPEDLDVPNPPYTPMVKSLTMGYSASATLNLDAKNAGFYRQYFYHIHPFGTEKIFPPVFRGASKPHFLLPQYEKDGYLYIGLADVKPYQTVSFLFQLVTKHIKEQTVYNIPKLTWSYLSRNNEWKDFNLTDLLSDTTDGFTQSGIIKIRMPRDVSLRGTVMPSSMYWIRVAAEGDIEMLAHTIAAHTQAVKAQWVDNGKGERLRHALPPFSIERLFQNNPAIKTVLQPFESFSGKAAENDDEYFTRISERLRHKGRAATHWDFERLILARFHELFQVKCISYLSHPEEEEEEEKKEEKKKVQLRRNSDSEIKVEGIEKGGGIILTVIPKRTEYMEDLTPVVNFRVLQEVEAFIKKIASPFIKIKVRNPEYEYIRVYCSVKFQDAGDSGQLIEQLKTDIKKYTCPWLFDNRIGMKIGGNISQDALKNHIAALPYVKFVTKFSMLHILEKPNGDYQVEDTAATNDRMPVIYASKPWSVIIPDNEHQITVIYGDEKEELPKPVERPVRFKSRHDILHRTTRIRIKTTQHLQEEDAIPNDGYEYTLNISL